MDIIYKQLLISLLIVYPFILQAINLNNDKFNECSSQIVDCLLKLDLIPQSNTNIKDSPEGILTEINC